MTAPPMRAAGATSLADAGDQDRARLAAAASALPALGELPAQLEMLPGGLTNRNYLVSTRSGTRAVARVSSGKSALLEIDRAAEFHNATIAADLGVGPGILGYAPGQDISLVDWIDGRTFRPQDLDDSTCLIRVAATCRALHGGPRFVNDFDMFEIQRRYLAVVLDHGFRLPDRYLEFLPAVDRIRAALALHPQPTVPCHNDLLAANIMDDGRRIWFIDYEYSGNNDPFFELGNLWSESDLPPERLVELVTAYCGHSAPRHVARARLLALMSQYGWTLWACIQQAVSEVEFDFWSWGVEKYERAVALFDGPELPHLIEDVSQSD